MLQEFYKDTIQSNYIKYILNQEYIPTVPFTSNIIHVTKGNIYIHDGYFVKANISDAVEAIREDIKNKPNMYDVYFTKYEPYVFGKQYKGLTTNYKSNTKGYDSTTHYYLGEYLRAYKAYYGIDLMPFYNCYSNEYIDYLYLNYNVENHHIEIKNSQNKKYKLISVPIKFCTKYTIAIQCNTEVTIAPMFIGKKGLLKDKTDQLYMINSWGKKYPRIDFNNPIVYESPHINSLNDLTQSYLQTYDKYLRLIIQKPENNESSIVVLEGEYSNTKPFQTRYINTSSQDVKEEYAQFYDTKLPLNDNINIPNNSYLMCKNINSQKYCLYFNDNNIITYYNENREKLEDLGLKYKLNLENKEDIRDNPNVKFPLQQIYIDSVEINESVEDGDENNQDTEIASLNNTINNDDKEEVVKETTETLEEHLNKIKGVVEESTPSLIAEVESTSTYKYILPLNLFCTDLNFIRTENNGDEKYSIYYNKDEVPTDIVFELPSTPNTNDVMEISKSATVSFKSPNKYSENDIFEIFKCFTGINNNNPERTTSRLVQGTDIETNINSFYIEHQYFYLTTNLIKDNIINIYMGDLPLDANNYSLGRNDLKINLIPKNAKYISLTSPNYLGVGMDSWEIVSQIDDKLFNLNNYLNKYLISNLMLLKFNNHISYAFSGRLIEYLVNAVIAKNELIPKNIQRVQQAVNLHNEKPSKTSMFGRDTEITIDDIWSDQLRIEAFHDVRDLNNYYDYLPLYDINGFIDKDSEKLLAIKNEV